MTHGEDTPRFHEETSAPRSGSTGPAPEREQELQARAWEGAQLARGRCPYSGLHLGHVETAAGAVVLMCAVCDCFGYEL